MDWSGFGLPTAFFPFFLLLLLGGRKLLPWNSSLRCRCWISWQAQNQPCTDLEQTWNKPFEFRLYTTSVLFCDLTLSSSSSSSSSGSIGTSSSSWSCCRKEPTHHWITTHDPLTSVLPFLSNETSETGDLAHQYSDAHWLLITKDQNDQNQNNSKPLSSALHLTLNCLPCISEHFWN